MDWLIVGQIIIGIVFVVFGLNHLLRSSGMISYIGSKLNVSKNIAAALNLIIALIWGLGGLGTVFGVAMAPLVLAAGVVAVTYTMHQWWNESDPAAKQGELTKFLVNHALVGALIMGYAALAIS